MKKKQTCTVCGDDLYIECPECEGLGLVWLDDSDIDEHPCDRCNGEGEIPCSACCNGEG